jgi:small redox-active disulfide protein 2
MKDIKILGTGCPKCTALYENTQAAVQTAGITANIEKVEKITEIIGYGVMNTPALVVDGEVKSAGKTLSAEQVTELLL